MLQTPPFTEDSALSREIDRLYADRRSPESTWALRALVERAAKDWPHSYELAWRTSRFWCWMGDTVDSVERRRDAGKAAWEAGERASVLHRAGVEGAFYAALGIGLYSHAVGVVHAVMRGLESKFQDHIDRAIELDPRFCYGGPPLAKGRLYYLLPWPKRDLERAEMFLRSALATNPESLRAQFYLAEVEIANKDRVGARLTLERVLQGDGAYDQAEAELVKRWARTALAAS